MATITGQAPIADPLPTSTPPASSRPPAGNEAPPRQLWQAPLFLAGLAFLALVCYRRSFSTDRTAKEIDHYLLEARQILNRANGDCRAAADAARKALDLAEAYPNRQGEAFFLLGSAEVRLADRAPAPSAPEMWKSARHNLEEANRLGVAEQDQGRLHYRLAKTMFHTDADPKDVADRLAASVEMADDRAEGYQLLTDAYLRLPEPNVAAALAANEKLRQVYLISPELMGLAQLQGAELLLRLGPDRADEARKVLDKIGSQAPASIRAKARILSARTYQAQKKEAQAAKLWKEALDAETTETSADRGQVLYQLGVCLANLGEPDEALKSWEECARGKGEEASAAAIALAEAHLKSKTPEKALPVLVRGLESVNVPADWKNSLVTIAKARDCLERTAQTYRKAGQFDLALQALTLYQKLAIPGEASLLRGDTFAEWARARWAAVHAMPPGDPRTQAEEEARKTNHDAAAAYSQADDELPVEKREDALWQACAVLLEGQCDREAVEALIRYLQVGKKPEQKAEAWYRLGECRAREQTPEAMQAAEEAYLNCTAMRSPRFDIQARYQLAQLLIMRGKLDDAEIILDQIIGFLHLQSDADPDMLRKTSFALGALAFRRGDYPKTVQKLKDFVPPDDPTTHYPPLTTPEATLARFHLVEAYRQLAEQAEQKARMSPTPEEQHTWEERYSEYLEKAAVEYPKLAKSLEAPEAARHLSPELRAQIPFVAAQCLYTHKEWDSALDYYVQLAAYYKGRSSAFIDPSNKGGGAEVSRRYPLYRLEALAGQVRCYFAKSQPDKVRLALDELRAELEKAEPAVKAEYQGWLDVVTKQIANMPMDQ